VTHVSLNMQCTCTISCEEFETFSSIVFQKVYYFSVFGSIPCIGTIFFYIVLYNSGYLLCYHLTLDTWHLHVITWHLLFITRHLLAINWHMFDITYHLPPVILSLDLWLSYYRNLVTAILYYIQWTIFLVLMYSCTPEFLNLTCSCYSHKLIITQ